MKSGIFLPLMSGVLGVLLCASATAAVEPFVFRGTIVVEADASMAAQRGGGMGMATTSAAASTSVPVEVYLPVGARASFSIVMVPGGGLSSWGYTATPDGRDGWAQYFARHGIAVYLMNPPNGTRDELGRWNQESVWPLWGFGPEFGTPYETSKFPVAAIGVLQASFHITRASGGAAHISTLLTEIGPAYVLGHSAGGGAMFSIARSQHENLRGTIAIETTNCPTDAEQLRAIYVDGARSFLSIWGDHLDRGAPSMLSRYESCKTAAQHIAAAEGRAQTLRLPEEQGIHGNTHLMMQDVNHDDIAALIIRWIRADGGAN